MNVYVVWKQPHDGEEDCYMGDENIKGVYTSELLAYKTACIKQVYEHLECDIECETGTVKENMEEWLQDNPFPDAEETDIKVWKDYFNIITDDNFAYKIHEDENRYNYVPLYDQYHVTVKELQIE